MDLNQQKDNWNELMRRLEALSPTPESAGTGMEVRHIPDGDPTGFIELAETLGRAHREQGMSLAEQFPFFESLFSPIPPWQRGGLEAYAAIDVLIKRGLEHVATLKRGTDYELFNDVGGEVTTFHFKDVDSLRSFRQAVGLDLERGFEALINRTQNQEL